MLDQLEIILHKIGSLVIGSSFIEYGISRWQQRPFSRKSLWTIIVLIYGSAMALKSFIGPMR